METQQFCIKLFICQLRKWRRCKSFHSLISYISGEIIAQRAARRSPLEQPQAEERGAVIFHKLIIKLSENPGFNTTQKISIAVSGMNYVFEMSPT